LFGIFFASPVTSNLLKIEKRGFQRRGDGRFVWKRIVGGLVKRGEYLLGGMLEISAVNKWGGYYSM